ncbi:hypothetical protein [Salinispora arenicola]|uniref:hypothetical protein n=1 Tax=Salinispora arenicola TaxID=168697 RepID=UPI0003A8464B|nr:hypothetical protein [Salinispora arenicola]
MDSRPVVDRRPVVSGPAAGGEPIGVTAGGPVGRRERLSRLEARVVARATLLVLTGDRTYGSVGYATVGRPS